MGSAEPVTDIKFNIGREKVMQAVTPAAVRVHHVMAAIPSIAAIERVEGEWELAAAERHISLEAVEWKAHAEVQPLILKNLTRLHEAISALSLAGYAYQNALSCVATGDVLSLAGLESCRLDPANAWEVNLIELSDFYRGFGLPTMASAIEQAAEVFLTQRVQARELPAEEQAAYEQLDAALGGKMAQCAYICPDTAPLANRAARPLASAGAVGVVVLTLAPLGDEEIKKLAAMPVAHLEPGLAASLVRKADKETGSPSPL